MKKWVYLFREGNASMRNLLGGKGSNLAEMTSLGLPIPQGFIVTTEACTDYHEQGRKITDEIREQIGYVEKVWGYRRTFVSISSFRSQSIYAWYDGYCT